MVQEPIRVFDEIFRTEHASIRELAYRYLLDSHSANDIAQEVFLKFWIHLESGRIGHDNYLGWLRTVASNLCRDQIQWAKHRRHLHIDTEVEYAVANRRSMHAEDLYQEAIEATRMLPERLQRPLLLTAVDGYSSEDAGKMVGISSSALRKRCELAKRTVKMLIKEKPDRPST